MIKCKLKLKRIEKNISQQDLSKVTGIRLQTISDMETGKSKSFGVENINALCDFFQCNIEDIMEYVPDNQSSEQSNTSTEQSTPHLLFDLRTKSGLTQTQAAKELDVDYSSYISYENGTQTAPLNFLLKACKLYNVSPSYFDINNNLSAVGNKGYSVTQKNNKKTIVGTNDSIKVSDDEFEAVKQFLEIIRNRK